MDKPVSLEDWFKEISQMKIFDYVDKTPPKNEFLKYKNLSQITIAQKNATENVFKKKNIPFRTFEIKKRDEKTLGELFCFFILETILIGQSMNLNPYDQPAVELIKKETNKILF